MGAFSPGVLRPCTGSISWRAASSRFATPSSGPRSHAPPDFITNAVTPRWDTCLRRSTSNQRHLNSVSTFRGELQKERLLGLYDGSLDSTLDRLSGPAVVVA